MTSPFSNARVWFITGSSQGIGRALLEALLKANERVVATLRKPEVLASLQAQYKPEQLLVLRLDVTDKSQITEAFAATKNRFGRLDVLVNNAGYGLRGEVEGIPDEAARRQIEVLFWAPVNLSIQAIQFMRDINPPGHGGKIFNISSVGGYSGNPTLSYYSAGKFALEGFTESVRKEMVPSWNIHIIIIQLGGFKTSWAGDSMVNYPPPAPYDLPDSPSNLFRKMMNHEFIGEPARAAEAMIKLADMNGSELPLRVQFGTESLILVKNKARRTIDDGQKWADFAHSTNSDGVDKDNILDHYAEANY